MKKFISVLLCVILVTIGMMPMASAIPANCEQLPVVVVPGYSASPLIYHGEDGTREHVWGLDIDEILGRVLGNIAGILKGLGLAITEIDPAYLADLVGRNFEEIAGKLKCNPDGTSIYNVVPLFDNTARATNAKNIAEEYGDDTSYQWETDIIGAIREAVGGMEMFYNFNCDFRMGAIENAHRLRALIEDIIATTGYEKVNLIAISHGGQVSATYMNLYAENTLINNAVLTVPAIGGAALAYDIMTNSIVFDELTLLHFVENGLVLEEDYHILVEAQQLGFLDALLENLVPYVIDILGYWGSIWDFMPLKYYEDIKNAMLDPVESADLIAKSDAMHALMANMGERLSLAEANGTDISIIAGTGNPSVTGLQENSDGIITTAASTGATCAPFDQRFADGYTQLVESDHYYVSPSMEIDASTAYLPDSTWFVDGLFHGMTYWDEYSRELMYILLLTEDIDSVWDDPMYPQFHAAMNASYSVHGAFDASTDGYLTSEDTAFVITNLSKEHILQITSIIPSQLPVEISLPLKPLAPGESVTVNVTWKDEPTSLTKGSVRIGYTLYGNLIPLGSRTLDFTVRSGEEAAFDADNMMTSVADKSLTENILGEKISTFLAKLGLLPFFENMFIFFKSVAGWISAVINTK
ncbi:MAG: hypothetical protein E7523_12195 [Ruminococcaceae bacterium]|nr:hypothetical protein [Oscillospiraceae bacterium]